MNHYTNHLWTNPVFSLSRSDLESHFESNSYTPTASADYDTNDYSSCGIEVVLETLFDDSRLHLTEKILRPIACNCPFILASTPGSLEYLKKYGFKTFAPYIDESYDSIINPLDRLEAIAKEMKKIASLNPAEKEMLFNQLKPIADYNKELFFSNSWINNIKQEFVNNINQSLIKLWSSRSGSIWKQLRSEIKSDFSSERILVYQEGSKEKLISWLEQPVEPLKINF